MSLIAIIFYLVGLMITGVICAFFNILGGDLKAKEILFSILITLTWFISVPVLLYKFLTQKIT